MIRITVDKRIAIYRIAATRRIKRKRKTTDSPSLKSQATCTVTFELRITVALGGIKNN